MKRCLLLVALIAVFAHADDGIDIRTQKELVQPGRVNWSGVSAADAVSGLVVEAQRRCPAGFEKVREYAAPEGEAWYLHFVVRCITPPATPVASAGPESK